MATTDPRRTGFSSRGPVQLKTLGAPVAGVDNTEDIVMQTQLAAGQWPVNGVIRVRLTGDKSGGTDTYLLTVRVGTAGTTADTALTGLSARAVMAGTSVAGGWEYDILLVSATSALVVGNASPAQSGYGASSSTAISAATTITNASTNALWVSVGIASGGASNTVAIRTGSISLVV
jgi:hypothetical protein